MIVRLITPLSNTANTLSVIALDASQNVIITDIVENIGGATRDNNPNLYAQLWEKNTNNVYTTFRNIYYNTYLSYSGGTSDNTYLTVNADGTQDSSNWTLSKQEDTMQGDPTGAPRSYAISALNTNQVIDLSGYSTSPGNRLWMYHWKGERPSDGWYNQFWYLEEPRIEVHNPTGGQVTITASNDSQEIIEVWDAMIGGNLLNSINETSTSVTINGYNTFYISSKKYQNSHKVNESENESNQVIDLSQNSSTTIQFYYGDPQKGATVTITR